MSNSFSTQATTVLYVPDGSRNLYWIHPYWGQFKSVNIINDKPLFLADNISYRVTSEEYQTVEVTGASLIDNNTALKIPSKVEDHDKKHRVAGIANNGLSGIEITSVSLPSTIGYVGLDAFKGCTTLNWLECKATTPPSVYISSFDEKTYSEATLSVREDVVGAYKNNDIWGKFELSPLNTIMVESIELDPYSFEAIEGETIHITATVYPEDATNKQLEWHSSNEGVATVDEDGNVTVHKKGECEITAKATDGSDEEATCMITNSTILCEPHISRKLEIMVYTTSGILVLKTEDPDELKKLDRGLYIICKGNKTKKIIKM